MKGVFINIIRLQTAFLSILSIVATTAHASVIVDNLAQPTGQYFGPLGNSSNTNNYLIAQEFTLPGGSYSVDKVTLLLNPTNGSGSVTVSLWNIGPDNNPSNRIAVVSSQSVTHLGNVDFVPTNTVILQSGSYYVVAAPTTSADNARVSWAVTTSNVSTGSGFLGSYADTKPGAWENFSGSFENYAVGGYRQQISIEATPVAPAVGISRQGAATVLSWPSASGGYAVESATNPALPAWQAITNVTGTVAGNFTVTNNWTEPSRIFRLRQSFAVDNLEQPTSGYFGPLGTSASTNNYLIGQEFTLPGGSNYTLNKVTLLLNPTNGSGNVTVSLWNVGSINNPSNEISTVSSQWVTNVGLVDFIPSTPITLPPGNYYVVAGPTAPADNGRVDWAYTASSIWEGFGILGSYADTKPGSWEIFPVGSYPQQMSVQATPASP